eukprot:TCONS_00047480-protein
MDLTICYMVTMATILVSIIDAQKGNYSRGLSGEFRLKKFLMDEYNPEVRPVVNDRDIVNLTFEIALQQIVEVNEKEESLSISVFFRQYWHDPNLMWDPLDYGNVTSTNFNPEMLWKPDVALYNNVEKDVEFGGQLDLLKNRIIVYHDGNVVWYSLGILNGKCPMNIRYFPFDTQICDFKFGPWTYHGHLVDIYPKRQVVDTAAYTIHSEWHLKSAEHIRNVAYYGCCVEPYPDVTVKIVLERRPLFYVLNLLLPMILIGVLTLLAFYLPAQSGERVSFAVTLLLAMTVFMLIVADMVPASSETIPLLGIFFTAVMVEMVLMVFSMCYVLKLHLIQPDDGEEIGPFMRRFVYDFLSYKFGTRKRRTDFARDEYKFHLQDSKTWDKNGSTKSHNGGHSYGQVINNGQDDGSRNIGAGDVDDSSTAALMEKNLRVMTDKMKEEENEKRIKQEFEICATTLDILALICFVALFILITTVYFVATT